VQGDLKKKKSMRNHDEARRQQEIIPFFATFAAQNEGLALENHSEDNTQVMLQSDLSRHQPKLLSRS